MRKYRFNKVFRLFGTAVVLMGLVALQACKRQVRLPEGAQPVGHTVSIYPDYKGVTIPPNIAPLNFLIKDSASRYVVSMAGRQGDPLLTAAGSNGTLSIDTAAWRRLLTQNRGHSVSVTVYAKGHDGWRQYPAFKFDVAAEPIDAYLSYRLIEPGYELYRQLGLYQRNLTNFDERAIYENNRDFSNEHNHCVNCHNYQNYSTRHMLFHVRASHGGTVFTMDGKVEKVNLKSDSLLSGAVYPAWHPHKNWIVFSSNVTGQAFHMYHKEKIEVLDIGSDLIFYDVDKHQVSNLLRTGDMFETFPAWAPTGDRLYYCAAEVPGFEAKADSLRTPFVLNQYNSLRYNLMSLSFDERTCRFGQPELVLNCAAMGKSATVPRVSPDGRYLLFTLGDYGQFHIWHKSSDLWVMDLKTRRVRPLTAANSRDVDSYHSWSSNGRWIVFSSRRDDGNYTRLYLSYFDAQGRDHKAFLLPQRDPAQNLRRLKSYNVPELTRDAVGPTPEQFKQTIYQDAGTDVTYKALK